ncbi:MAG: hypothetical protein JSU77_04325 [Fidelibacterota bacterium]|nr:MAG: hypothetical protein JSU77_04325 [Candidatus Neomarinimicrobiota bacterium]
MTRQKVGLTLFGIAALWAILWGLVGSVFANEAYHLTRAEVDQTMWAPNGPWLPIWGLVGVPVGALVAGFGMLLYSGAAGATVWKYGVAMLAGLVVGVAGMFPAHIPPLFGLGGSLILACFLGILWFWAKERRALSNSSATAADLRMAGYVFLVIGAWFTCGSLAEPFLPALEGGDPDSPLHIMIFFVLGWIFLFISQCKVRAQKENPAGV